MSYVVLQQYTGLIYYVSRFTVTKANLNAWLNAENCPQQFHIIELFFVPSTFLERHAHSMTKRVLDDLVPCRLRSFHFRDSAAVDR